MVARQLARFPLWWTMWGTGVLIVPIAGWLVPRDGLPYPVVFMVPGRAGVLLWVAWGVAFGLMFGAMLGLRRAGFRTVAVAQLCAGLFVATFTPAAPSSDPYSYIVYGETAQRGGNPWQRIRVTTDYDAMRVAARSAEDAHFVGPSTYGPLFMLAERALVAVVPKTATARLVLIERYLATFAAVGVTLLVRGPRIAFWGLHPLVLFLFPVAAHNDVLMLLLLAASLRIRNAFFSGVALGAAAAVKLVAIGALVFRPKRMIVQGIGAALTIGALLVLQPKAATLGPLLHVSMHSGYGGGSVIFVAEKFLTALHLADPKLTAQLLLLGTLLLVLYRVRRRWSRRDASLYGVLILLGLSPFVWINYVSWALFPALWASRPIRGVALTLSGAAWILNLGIFTASRPHGTTVILWICVAFAALYFLGVPRLRRTHRRPAFA
jgi:hypothetical protein